MRFDAGEGGGGIADSGRRDGDGSDGRQDSGGDAEGGAPLDVGRRDGGGSPVTYCSNPYPPPAAITGSVISDFESGLTVQAIQPGGTWEVLSDGRGSTGMTVEPCGTNGKGLHFTGRGHNLWGAGAGVAIVSTTQPVDASAFRGIQFVMTTASPVQTIFKVQNPYSQPECGKCNDGLVGEECQSGFYKTFSITSDATPHTVAWSDLYQQSWGYRPPGSAYFDAGNLVNILFAFDQNTDFDVCIDDVRFVQYAGTR
jgi:hypothetical protein